MSSGHSHGPGGGHGHSRGRAADRSRLRWALSVTVVVMVVQIFGALMSGSLALLADAAHMATDAAAVVLALGASYVAAMPARGRSTFGYHRAEILAALINALALLVVCGFLIWTGITRLRTPVEVDAPTMVIFAVVGMLANAVSLGILSRSDTGSLNLRAAAAEVFGDLLGSVLVIVAGVIIWTTDFQRADPLASLVIAAVIAPRAVRLLREAAVILLEIAPPGLELDDVREHLMGSDGVTDVHDLHAWTITSGMPCLSAHVTMTDVALEARGVGRILDELAECVAVHFDVQHATFQLEPESHKTHEDLGEPH